LDRFNREDGVGGRGRGGKDGGSCVEDFDATAEKIDTFGAVLVEGGCDCEADAWAVVVRLESCDEGKWGGGVAVRTAAATCDDGYEAFGGEEVVGLEGFVEVHVQRVGCEV
jgi:hypothetical protein